MTDTLHAADDRPDRPAGSPRGTSSAPTAHPLRESWPIGRREALRLAIGYVVLVAVWVGIGKLITGPLADSAITRTDDRLAQWFADHRTDTWNTLSYVGSTLSETWVKVLVTGTAAAFMMRFWHRWYEALIVAGSLIIEAAAFLAITLIVGRDRPPEPRLDESPIGSSFPSGHVAAAVAYAAFAVVVFWHTRNRIARTTAVVVCAIVPVLVGLARMYRGMHFLSDVLAGAVLGGATVILTVAVLRRSDRAVRFEP